MARMMVESAACPAKRVACAAGEISNSRFGGWYETLESIFVIAGCGRASIEPGLGERLFLPGEGVHRPDRFHSVHGVLLVTHAGPAGGLGPGGGDALGFLSERPSSPRTSCPSRKAGIYL